MAAGFRPCWDWPKFACHAKAPNPDGNTRVFDGRAISQRHPARDRIEFRLRNCLKGYFIFLRYKFYDRLNGVHSVKGVVMRPRMKRLEQALFEDRLRLAKNYVEFGSGGSTCLASSMRLNSIISIDSSKEWHEKVHDYCASNDGWTIPTLYYVDIGPLRDWGKPADRSQRKKWPDYHTKVWGDMPESRAADFYMVDGRFRVACFMQILLHGHPDATIAIHDFDREFYYPILDVADRIASAEAMSIFCKKPKQDEEMIRNILKQHEYKSM
jgi:hypothetical protein